MNKKILIPIVVSVVVILFVGGVAAAAFFIYKWEKGRGSDSETIEEEEKVSRKELLQNAQSWVYDLSFADEADADKLAESNFDIVVVDISDVDKDVVKDIKKDNDKLVICYMSIGQAESYRDDIYWEEDWGEGDPAWIDSLDPYWEENYNIEFWRDEWKEIVFEGEESYLNLIMESGFDGVYLDTAGLSYWEDIDMEETESGVINVEEEMIKLIEEISDYAKNEDDDFLIIPQNLGFMKKNYSGRLEGNIDAVGQEEVFYGYENEDGVKTANSISKSVSAKLDKYKEAGLPVLVVDYPFQCEEEATCYDKDNLVRMVDSYSKGWAKGYIVYSQNRGASGVTYSIPRILRTEVTYENLPILSWEFYSASQRDSQGTSFRIFVSSTKEKLHKDEPDVYDSGKVKGLLPSSREALGMGMSGNFGFIPDEEIEEGTYYWKVVVYDEFEEVSLPSPWSEIKEFKYEKPEDLEDLSEETSISQTAWIPSWDFENGFESLKTSKDRFESVSPVWFEFEEDGTLTRPESHNEEEFVEFCEENGIKLIPSVALFSSDVIHKTFNERLDEHVDEIYEEVKDGDYDGVDIDYESTYLKDKQLYFEFLEKLSEKLHEDDKLLSVTVLSKWSDENIYNGLPETRQVQDWEKISKYADEVRIMAYDYTTQNSYVPGPISPIYWEELVLRHAIKKIPREKIVLALPLYGYSFRVDERSDISTDIFEGGEIAGSERRVLAYTFEDIKEVNEEFAFETSFEKYSQEEVIEYRGDNYDRVIYIVDERGIKARRELAAKYGIKGVAYWRLGGEDGKSFE